MKLHPYEALSRLIEYPTEHIASQAHDAIQWMNDRSPEIVQELSAFAKFVSSQDIRDLEEQYAQTFDLNPSRCLDLGYQVFGETYKRGVFLVKMKAAVREHALDPGSELHDYIPVVLRLIPRLDASEDPVSLVVEGLLPAMEKVIRTFDNQEDPFCRMLRTIERILMEDFGVDHVEPPPLMDHEINSVNTGGKKLPMFPGFNPPAQGFAS